jgi:hypothetical protein
VLRRRRRQRRRKTMRLKKIRRKNAIRGTKKRDGRQKTPSGERRNLRKLGREIFAWMN